MNIRIEKNIGITLIALVITIVVLIILAAVAINLSLGNNGIFNRAKTAKEKYANAQEYEQTEINNASTDIYSYISGNRDNVTVEKVQITNIASGWSVQNGSVKIGDVVILNCYFQKTAAWTVGWNNSVAKISVPIKFGSTTQSGNDYFELLHGGSGTNAGELLIAPDGTISLYSTKTWSNTNDFLKCNAVYYVGE